MRRYEKVIAVEDAFYKEYRDEIKPPTSLHAPYPELDKALDWLCEGCETIVDFGCGSGSLLFRCAMRDVQNLIGVDASCEAIQVAQSCAKEMRKGSYTFWQGSIACLISIPSFQVDGVILSNIIDNLYPEDARMLLLEVARILKQKGNVLVKLNPYLTKETIEAWNMKEIQQDVYEDERILWNQSDAQWCSFFQQEFEVHYFTSFWIEEAKQENRLLYLCKK